MVAQSSPGIATRQIHTQFRLLGIEMRQVPLIVRRRYTTKHFEIFAEMGLIMEIEVTSKGAQIDHAVMDAPARFIYSENTDKRFPGNANPLLAEAVNVPGAV
ncbi:hypothetical protein ECZC01_42660 [Escherichia coli]|jgi:hypothetical protein|nr:hypothetical protein TUM9754_41220 [Escherichia coli]GHL18177.1 hypothetical protein ECZU24_10180 [Escherichia coli]GJH48060.1 hypothetical protein ECZC01_42660 [Escherichia coli]